MVRYLDIHPQDPQPRLLAQAAAILADGGLIAYPTDSGYALGCALGNQEGKERIAGIRRLDERHHYTLVCSSFAQLGQFVLIDNSVFRAIKAATPGPFTFILPATREVPRRLMHPKKKTVGVRHPDHARTFDNLEFITHAKFIAPLVGGALVVYEQGEEIRPVRHEITEAKIRSGLAAMLEKPYGRRHLTDLMNDNADAETYDVFIQFVAFGDVKYG